MFLSNFLSERKSKLSWLPDYDPHNNPTVELRPNYKYDKFRG